MRGVLAAVVVLAACGGGGDAGPDAHPTESAIHHVVVIVQENHTFDNYFGSWCTAAPGSAPTCTDGPACCEAAPATDPTGIVPRVLDDAANADHDPNHTRACEVIAINGGAMDQFGAGGGECSDVKNIAISPAGVVDGYRALAAEGALADRYFQPLPGASFANDMYFAVAEYVFDDNTIKPDGIGSDCSIGGDKMTFRGVTTIADLLLAAGRTFAVYAQGYADMVAHPDCPHAPPDCPFGLPITPCSLDPADIPFQYYEQFQDVPEYIKDYDDFARDLDAGRLPSFAFVKPVGYKSEHPGLGTLISPGVDQVTAMVAAIAASSSADDTLVLVVWDEGGGYWDHIAPPPDSPADGQPYGPRAPLIAIGPFARTGAISHVTLEHSSIVKFLEWNFLDGETGQLAARDAEVANLGSLLDPAQTVPEN
jgi:phospholipase C